MSNSKINVNGEWKSPRKIHVKVPTNLDGTGNDGIHPTYAYISSDRFK